jgi:hypothetical protein
MNRFRNLLSRSLKDESGQIIPWLVFLSILFIGVSGLTLDLGHAYVCFRDLQASTDAAALAGAWEMSQPNATAADISAYVNNFSSNGPGSPGGGANGANANPNLPAPVVTTTMSCVAALSTAIPCASAYSGYNALQVKQTTNVPTLFIRALSLFGVQSASSIPITAVSTAAMRGASASAWNLAIVLDTTESMNNTDNDTNCNNTQLYCSEQGIQQLLVNLSPCTAGSTSSNCIGAFDTVSLFTFPNIQANDASDDTSCPSSNPAIPAYSTPTPGATWSAPTGTNPTYQVTGFLDNYLTTNQSGGTVAATSALGVATGADTKCKGMQAPGGDGTYYAGAIYAAGAALQAAHALNTNSQNALIILTDGAANTSKMTATPPYTKLNTNGTYPSLADQCQQGVTAANWVSNNIPDTTVYVVAYGASTQSGQCTTDPSLTPCKALQEMASNPGTFYSDSSAQENRGQCASASNPSITGLDTIFTSIYNQFTIAKVIPNSEF